MSRFVLSLVLWLTASTAEGMAVGTSPSVEMLTFLPMLPPLSPGAAASPSLQVEGAQLSKPVYLPELGSLVLVDRGTQVLQTSASSITALPGGEAISAHALLAGSAIVTAGGNYALRCVLADQSPPTVGPLPMNGATELAAARCGARGGEPERKSRNRMTNA